MSKTEIVVIAVFVAVFSGVLWIAGKSNEKYVAACHSKGMDVTFFRGKGVCVREDGVLVDSGVGAE